MKPTDVVFYRNSLPGIEPPRGDQEILDVIDGIAKTLAIDAFKRHGEAAFDAPILLAAIHEAGHAKRSLETPLRNVSSQRNALLPNGKRKPVWLGFTSVKNKVPFKSNETTPAGADIICASNKIAGLAAEMVFDPDCRDGSSLDEIAFCQVLCGVAGAKLSIDGEAIYETVHHWTIEKLQHYAAEHKAIASALIRNKELRSRHLQCFLRNVEVNPNELVTLVYKNMAPA
ncbi:MAG TPA: hypothetical protein VGP28_04625 [Methylocella sp.]|jgi:hypothetical protein|nr:hypothetical protein [Methylocella sp.]